MGYFHTFHPCQPQQPTIFCTTSQLINCMQRNCISAILRQNSIKHSPDIHQMYSTVSIGLPHMESPTGFSQAPLKQGFLTSHYRTSSFCCLPIFFITTLQAPYKQYTKFQQVLTRFLTYYFSASNKIPFLEVALSPCPEASPGET